MPSKELGKILKPLGLEKIDTINQEEVNPDQAREYASSLRNILWTAIEEAKEDRLIITSEVKQELFGLADMFHSMAEKTGNPESVLIGEEESIEQVRDGFKRVIEFNQGMQNKSERQERGISIETIQWEAYSAHDFKNHFEFLNPDAAKYFHQLIVCIEDVSMKGNSDDIMDFSTSLDSNEDEGSEFTLQFMVNVSAISEDAREKLKEGLTLIASSGH